MDRPFTFINSAMSADGKISTKQRKQVRISGDVDFDRMDELRATSDAVLVGIGTVLADDPSLTVKSSARRDARRDNGMAEDPFRIVVDSHGRTPLDADIFNKGSGRRLIAVSKAAPHGRVESLRQKAEIVVAGEDRVDIEELVRRLKNMGIDRLMVEGGATLNWGLLSHGLVDEIYTFVGNMIIGGGSAPTLVDGTGFAEDKLLELDLLSAERMEDGMLLKWHVTSRS
ncbi:MAG: 2,5-diamino-6-(ribosylamino)-4(3H)-pyrimidinone 5'-phosphate reductase [Euryarchaeota archaeon]|nr:2,5-diamino-6-(ribosylamino)-4(3H)-pyrimidinone 5'-phosphate reductase [Euryarchaeota archaeon]